MKPNIGDGERLVRVILGIYVMLLGFLFIQGVVGTILGVLGLIAFATGSVGWCGIYALMGKSTLETPPDDEQEQPVKEQGVTEPEQSATEDEVTTDNASEDE